MPLKGRVRACHRVAFCGWLMVRTYTEPNHLMDDNHIDFSRLRLTRETKSNGQVGYYMHIDQQGDFDQYLIDNSIDVPRHRGVVVLCLLGRHFLVTLFCSMKPTRLTINPSLEDLGLHNPLGGIL